MIIIIPKQLIALITFPGIILHEISHRFMCDIFNIPVYQIDYFALEEDSVGKVIHQKIYSYRKSFFIAMAPLFINTFIAMLLTIPLSICSSTNGIIPASSNFLINFLFKIISWMGFTIGLHAIPSNQDVNNLKELAHTKTLKIFTYILIKIIAIFNIAFIGFWMRIFYVSLIMALSKAFLFGKALL
ncbi:MAG: hypothetical protein ACXWL2_05185 [Candidatus Chromulinivorax sp.]